MQEWRMEKDIPSKWNQKQTRIAIDILDKEDFKQKLEVIKKITTY
jgi:hypothetical protein